MRQVALLFIITFCLALYSCQTAPKPSPELKEFNEYLGKEKAEALTFAVQTFDGFLLLNYPDYATNAERIDTFFTVLKKLKPAVEWKFDKEANKKMLSMLETSGMRQEIWMYGDESGLFDFTKKDTSELDTLTKRLLNKPQLQNSSLATRSSWGWDNMILFNGKGAFLQGLEQYAQQDSFIQNYIRARKMVVEEMNRRQFVGTYLKNKLDDDNPFIKRIIVAELYMSFVKDELKI